MKKTITLSALLLMSLVQANAKVWRVNNTTGTVADFTDLSTAVSDPSVGAGDTIYLEGAVNYYGYGGTININKELIIIGSGYFLSETANTKTQWNTDNAKVNGIIFSAGSEGSVISGVEIAQLYLNASNITVERNKVNYIFLAYSTDVQITDDIIRQNYLDGVILYQQGNNSAKNIYIYNNLITTSIDFYYNIDNAIAYIINNIFVGSNNNRTSSCVFQNNIFVSPSVNFTSAAMNDLVNANYFSHNIFPSNYSYTGLPTGSNSNITADMANVFVDYNNGNAEPSSTSYSHDGKWQLKTGSPALNAGDLNGTAVNCGAFGGPSYYILSGMPNIPSIYALTVPDQVTAGTTSITVSLSSAAH